MEGVVRQHTKAGTDAGLACHFRRLPSVGFRLLFAGLCMLGWLSAAYAGTVYIKIKSQPATALAPGFSGFNVPQPRNGVEYYDPKFLAAVTPLHGGWVRYPGGTTSMDFDWSTGFTNMSWMNSLIGGNPPAVSGQASNILTTSQQLTQAKGGAMFSDFATFAHSLGVPAILCFNTFTDTNPGSATRMALAAQSYGLNVLEWELGNEAYLYPQIYPTAASYAAASNSYYNDIVTGTPGATVGVFPGGWYPGTVGCGAPAADPQACFPSWDMGLQAYTPQYWNAASDHIYPVVGTQTAQNTILALNGVLAHGSADYVNSYLLPLVGANTPIFITELNCCSSYTNKFLSYIYNGIFLAEYIMRLSSVPSVKGVGINSLYTDNSDYHGLIQSVNDFESYLLGQLAQNANYSTNTATNPDTQFQFYISAPGLAMAVANLAINNSGHLWPTSVVGGPTVNIAGFDGNPIPAVYAQAYLAKTGHHYVLITNKSAAAQSAIIDLNGAQVQATFTVTYAANSSALAANSATAPTNVQIQTTTSGNPVSLAAYSVTTVYW
jgi:hypothetical protein